MDIKYKVINNDCYINNNGIILIDTINFDNQKEADKFLSYDILWSGDLTNTILSQDKRILYNLKNGTYSFKIKSLVSDSYSREYVCVIETPEQLQIKDVVASKYSCGSNGRISIYINGGQKPYYYYINETLAMTSESSEITLENLTDGIYNISAKDSNDCKAIYNQQIVINSSKSQFEINRILTPKIIDSYVPIYFTIKGKNGPFDLIFHHTYSDQTTTIKGNDNNYLISNENDQYLYYIPDRLYPGSYNITMLSVDGCSSNQTFSLPNILPMTVNFNITPNNGDINIVSSPTLPIFDTVLIPYNLIINNKELLEELKKYNIKQYISININNILHKFLITRNILNKYLLESDQLEVLRFGEHPRDWYFYLQIAPGINLEKDPEHRNHKISLQINDKELPIILGVSSDGGRLSTEQISLVRGSLILDNILDNQFTNNKEYYITFQSQINTLDDYAFKINNSQITIHKNTYNVGFVTILNFLNNFTDLNDTVSLHKTNNLKISQEIELYIINIKNLLESINNIHNAPNMPYVYFDNTTNNGSLSIAISGQPYFTMPDSKIYNEYFIDYYYFNSNSIKLNNIYKNNTTIINERSISHLPEGFVLIKIKDYFGNKPTYIKYGPNNISYDIHFQETIKLIQNYNSNLLSLIEYGDIICYIPNTNNSAIDPESLINIPTFIPHNFIIKPQNIVAFNKTNNSKKIAQTTQNTNTSLNIKIYPRKTKCILKGPNNYQLILQEDTNIINMVPGVYYIYGYEQDLFDKNLNQNPTRIILDKNNNLDINIKFTSYNNQVFIKETE